MFTKENEETLHMLPTEESIMTQVRSIEGSAGQEVRKQMLRSMLMKQARFLQDCGHVQVSGRCFYLYIFLYFYKSLIIPLMLSNLLCI